MIALALDIATGVLLLIGVVFLLISAVGMIRLPDFYSRLHAAGIADTLAAESIVIGLLLQSPDWIVAVKLVLIGVFLFLTTPTATHAVANAAFVAGLRPMLSDRRDDREKE